jgi:hypothetical protein
MFAERLICSWIGALVLASGALCQTYVQFSVDGDTGPTSINKKGEIAGYYDDFAFNSHGFVRDPSGKITTFDVPGSSATVASSVNDKGAITGYYLMPTGTHHGFIRDSEGNFTTFEVPRSIATGGQSINAGGAVTGSYADSKNIRHGFVRRDNGTFISFDPPESIQTISLTINSSGAVTGWYQDASLNTHGFVRGPDGEIVSIDGSFQSHVTYAYSINNAGAITGSFIASTGVEFGYVRYPDGFTTLSGIRPASINNEGATTGVLPGVEPPFAELQYPNGDSSGWAPPFCGSPLSPTSINDEYVITGSCEGGGSKVVGWVRFPGPQLVYVGNSGSGNVSGYTINRTTGALKAVSGSPFAAGSLPASVAVDSSDTYAYVANAGSGNVSAYTINPTTGALTPISGSPFAAGSNPVAVAVARPH